uniref:Trace amine-associated receptor n=1 Tax=Coilia nasus TaxID=365059 RepID=A0A3S6CHT3_COINA|nr:trace amine-associated receptor [Coilia nasus]
MTLLSVEDLHSYNRSSVNLSLVTEQHFCSNHTCDIFEVTPVDILTYVCKLAVIIMAVCGNLLVIISICHFKQLHTPTNYIILSLAVVDMLVGITVLPGQLILLNSCLKTGMIFCYFTLICTYCLSFLSIYNVSLISLDRLYALWKPLLYASRVSVKVMSKVIFVTWIISLVYNLGLVYLVTTGRDDVLCIGDCSVALNEIWSTVDIFIVFVLPCSIIIVSYLKIFTIARKHARSISVSKKQTIPRIRSKGITLKASERKAAFTLGKLVLVFVLCLLPPFLTLVFSDSIPDALLQEVMEGAMLVHYLHSAINPLVYAFFYPWFRKCAKLILMLKTLNPDTALLVVLSNNG